MNNIQNWIFIISTIELLFFNTQCFFYFFAHLQTVCVKKQFVFSQKQCEWQDLLLDSRSSINTVNEVLTFSDSPILKAPSFPIRLHIHRVTFFVIHSCWIVSIPSRFRAISDVLVINDSPIFDAPSDPIMFSERKKDKRDLSFLHLPYFHLKQNV